MGHRPKEKIMSDPFTAGAIITGGSALLGNLAGIGAGNEAAKAAIYTANENFKESKRMNDANLAAQKEKFEYDKQLQQTIFNREDTAAQRRASDLEAAGLSKTLAAGQGAGAGTAVSTAAAIGDAPQRDQSIAHDARMRTAEQIAQLGMIMGETRLRVAQAREAEANAKIAEAEADVSAGTKESRILESKARAANEEYARQDNAYKAQMAKTFNLPFGMSPYSEEAYEYYLQHPEKAPEGVVVRSTANGFLNFIKSMFKMFKSL